MDPSQTIKLVIDMGPSGKNVEDTAREMDRLKTSTKAAAAAADELNPAVTHATNKMAGFGQTALQSGRFLQDFAQGGVGGVLNNIEGLAMALGGGPGLAGVMTAVGLAAFFAMPKLKEFWAALTGGDVGADAVRRALDNANERLNSMKDRAEDIAKAFERMAKAPTGAEAKGAKTLEQLITEAPTEAITRGITGALVGTEQGAKIDAARKQIIDNLERARDAAVLQKDREFAQAELDKQLLAARRDMVQANRRQAEAMMGRAVQPGAAGAAAREQIAALARDFPGRFPEGFAGEVEATSPEAIRRQQRFEKDIEVRKQVQDRIRRDTEARNRELEARAKDEARGPAEQEKQRLERNREAERLNLEGQQVQDQAREKGEQDRLKDVHDSQQLGRAVDRAFQERRRQLARPAGVQHLPLIPPGASREQELMTIAETQTIINQNNFELMRRQRIAEQANMGARRVRQQLQADPGMGFGGR